MPHIVWRKYLVGNVEIAFAPDLFIKATNNGFLAFNSHIRSILARWGISSSTLRFQFIYTPTGRVFTARPLADPVNVLGRLRIRATAAACSKARSSRRCRAFAHFVRHRFWRARKRHRSHDVAFHSETQWHRRSL